MFGVRISRAEQKWLEMDKNKLICRVFWEDTIQHAEWMVLNSIQNEEELAWLQCFHPAPTSRWVRQLYSFVLRKILGEVGSEEIKNTL